MQYGFGVDLGTTYTAAAVAYGQRLEIVDLGTRTAVVPSVVYARDDGTLLTGEAALRRGTTDPVRMSREFKRRMGDTTAILLGGTPYSVDALMASLLRSVVSRVSERQGEPPTAIAIAHPANWGQYKKDLLSQAVSRADLDGATLVTEPEAAAVHYATLERLDPDSVVAVYDLGGGTFDAAVVRKTVDGFDLIGEPQGIERLGGIDFDEAVFHHVLGALGSATADLDPDDVVVQAALGRLRDECVAAKEALSNDTETTIPVILPNIQTDVHLSRSDFESMIRPALADTLVVLRRALRSAGVEAGDLHSVLLVGGTSRIPLIAQLVSDDLGRPVTLDVHPKHSVALGAAAIAAESLAGGPATVPAPGAPVTTPMPVTPPPVAAVATSSPDTPPRSGPAMEGAAVAPLAAAPPPTEPPQPGRTKRLWIGAAAAAVLAIVAAVTVVALMRDGDGEAADDTGTPTEPTAEATEDGSADETEPPTAPEQEESDTAGGESPVTTLSPNYTTSTTTSTTSTTIAPIYPCNGVVEPCVVITDLAVDDTGAVQVTWEPRNFTPDVNNGYHAHLFWNSYTADRASSDAPIDQQVPWDPVEETVHTSQQVLTLENRPPEATGVCAATGLAPAHVVPNPALVHCVELPAGSI